MKILSKQRGVQRILTLKVVCIQICCCVLIGIYLSMQLCFYWNITNIHIQMLSDYTVILFIEIKWHENLITRMVKHRPLMYKNGKKTFEILRSEITFLMDLYI